MREEPSAPLVFHPLPAPTIDEAGELAKTLLMLGHGAAYGAASAAAHKKNLEGLVRLGLRPLIVVSPKRAPKRRRA